MQLLLGAAISVALSALVAGVCYDINNNEVPSGNMFHPLGTDHCMTCRCRGNVSSHCFTPSCQRPTNCLALIELEGKCCEYRCLDPVPGYPNQTKLGKDYGFGDVPVTRHGGTSTNLGMRLVASTVTSFLILAFLLFVIHRFRQRRLAEMVRRLNERDCSGTPSLSRRFSNNVESHLSNIYHNPVTIQFPPYEEPPPPYTPYKSPNIPPPPYEANPSPSSRILMEAMTQRHLLNNVEMYPATVLSHSVSSSEDFHVDGCLQDDLSSSASDVSYRNEEFINCEDSSVDSAHDVACNKAVTHLPLNILADCGSSARVREHQRTGRLMNNRSSIASVRSLRSSSSQASSSLARPDRMSRSFNVERNNNTLSNDCDSRMTQSMHDTPRQGNLRFISDYSLPGRARTDDLRNNNLSFTDTGSPVRYNAGRTEAGRDGLEPYVVLDVVRNPNPSSTKTYPRYMLQKFLEDSSKNNAQVSRVSTRPQKTQSASGRPLSSSDFVRLPARCNDFVEQGTSVNPVNVRNETQPLRVHNVRRSVAKDSVVQELNSKFSSNKNVNSTANGPSNNSRECACGHEYERLVEPSLPHEVGSNKIGSTVDNQEERLTNKCEQNVKTNQCVNVVSDISASRESTSGSSTANTKTGMLGMANSAQFKTDNDDCTVSQSSVGGNARKSNVNAIVRSASICSETGEMKLKRDGSVTGLQNTIGVGIGGSTCKAAEPERSNRGNIEPDCVKDCSVLDHRAAFEQLRSNTMHANDVQTTKMRKSNQNSKTKKREEKDPKDSQTDDAQKIARQNDNKRQDKEHHRHSSPRVKHRSKHGEENAPRKSKSKQKRHKDVTAAHDNQITKVAHQSGSPRRQKRGRSKLTKSSVSSTCSSDDVGFVQKSALADQGRLAWDIARGGFKPRKSSSSQNSLLVSPLSATEPYWPTPDSTPVFDSSDSVPRPLDSSRPLPLSPGENETELWIKPEGGAAA